MYRFVIKKNYLDLLLCLEFENKKIRELQRAVNMDYSHLTNVLQQLDKEGIVIRDMNNNAYDVCLTGKGKEICKCLRNLKQLIENDEVKEIGNRQTDRSGSEGAEGIESEPSRAEKAGSSGETTTEGIGQEEAGTGEPSIEGSEGQNLRIQQSGTGEEDRDKHSAKPDKFPKVGAKEDKRQSGSSNKEGSGSSRSN